MTDTSPHYSQAELEAMLGSVGSHVQVDRSVRIFGAKSLHVGSHVRIDPFTIISAGAGVRIGNHVHIAQFCLLLGSGAPLIIEDFAGLSSRVSVYTANDDYTGGALTGPTVPAEYRNVHAASVAIRRHAIIGCGAVIMPGAVVGLGAAIGALSFVNREVPEFTIMAGAPLRRVGARDGERLLALERKFLDAER